MSQVLSTYEIDTETEIVKYPTRVSNNECGTSLVATQDIAVGTVVERFVGKIVKYNEVPLEEIRYVAGHGDEWTIPLTNARHINHCCDPNCKFNDKSEVIAIRPIKAGEEISIDYIAVSWEEFNRNPQDFWWDPRWSFECLCGKPNCYKHIDHYEIK